jgi:hypothetical protein
MAGGNVAPERRLVFGVGEVSSQPARPRRFSFGGLPRSEIFILEKDAQPAASTGRPLEWQVLGVRIGVNVVCKWLRGRFKRALGLPWAAWSALPRRVISFDPFSRLHTDSSRTPCSVIGLRHRRNLFYWGNQEAATEAVSHAVKGSRDAGRRYFIVRRRLRVAYGAMPIFYFCFELSCEFELFESFLFAS